MVLLCMCIYMYIYIYNLYINPDPQCIDRDVRLVGGSVSHEGTVHYCGAGVWGSVCNDNWDSSNALVVCRQLGLPTASRKICTCYVGNKEYIRYSVQK